MRQYLLTAVVSFLLTSLLAILLEWQDQEVLVMSAALLMTSCTLLLHLRLAVRLLMARVEVPVFNQSMALCVAATGEAAPAAVSSSSQSTFLVPVPVPAPAPAPAPV